MEEFQIRQVAVQRVLAGEKVSIVSRSYGKSRKWLYLWLARFEQQSSDPKWFEGQSKAPKNKPTKIADTIEQRVLMIRKELQDRNYAQTGAIAIQYEFHHLGWSVPAVWTINRILARHGIGKEVVSHKNHKEYPALFAHVHHMDFVGPRYIKGDGRFYSVNIIDTLTHTAFVKAIRCKTAEQSLLAVVEFWSSYGMPDALQMDNDLAFRGSNRHPRSFGNVVRLALSQGVAPVFIPMGEPWRNGIIEKFNDTYDKRFLRKITFGSFAHLREAEKDFTSFHNQHHRYSSQQHRTPFQMTEQTGKLIVYTGEVHKQPRIPLRHGCVYFVRFIRSDLKLQINTETFVVKPALKYSYVVAEVNIDNHCIVIRQNNEIIQVFDYPIPVDW